MNVIRGQVVYADLGIGTGSEQAGTRPVVIIQNDMGNKYSPTVIVAPLTTQVKTKMPTHVKTVITGKKSTILMEQVRTIDKKRLQPMKKSIHLTEKEMQAINKAIAISLGITQ